MYILIQFILNCDHIIAFSLLYIDNMLFMYFKMHESLRLFEALKFDALKYGPSSLMHLHDKVVDIISS